MLTCFSALRKRGRLPDQTVIILYFVKVGGERFWASGKTQNTRIAFPETNGLVQVRPYAIVAKAVVTTILPPER